MGIFGKLTGYFQGNEEAITPLEHDFFDLKSESDRKKSKMGQEKIEAESIASEDTLIKRVLAEAENVSSKVGNVIGGETVTENSLFGGVTLDENTSIYIPKELKRNPFFLEVLRNNERTLLISQITKQMIDALGGKDIQIILKNSDTITISLHQRININGTITTLRDYMLNLHIPQIQEMKF